MSKSITSIKIVFEYSKNVKLLPKLSNGIDYYEICLINHYKKQTKLRQITNYGWGKSINSTIEVLAPIRFKQLKLLKCLI